VSATTMAAPPGAARFPAPTVATAITARCAATSVHRVPAPRGTSVPAH
jgi:hypothetical protein